ncbi:hypothetical protein CTRI78_v008115 [Colletotrichum trifolii]|uniref:Uncharacterized protein n=1 Tax=Colletotrichum trifolii TaxID=5466 RepID=A0A4R8R0E7_COLTR|nr:hypothetical protein CTRI78_v008115 [Colletotrichum trifolii]
MSTQPLNQAVGSYDTRLAGQRHFKRHKVLPHPTRQRTAKAPSYEVRSTPEKYDLVVDTAVPAVAAPQPSSPQILRHQSGRVSSGPDLPPTPPSHSRTSSRSHSIPPPSPTHAEEASQTPTTPARAPATPPTQKSPPTPDVTPPQPATRPKAMRPVPVNRTVSKATTAESRTESFRTAREDPYSSEDDDVQSTVRPKTLSARTSQNTVRRVSGPQTSTPMAVGLGLGLESPQEEEDLPTPKANGDFGAFDGDWASNAEVEQEWDDNLGRTVTVRKRRHRPQKKTTSPPRRERRRVEIIEDRVVTPTNATKALRTMSHRDRAAFYAPSEIAWPNSSTQENKDSRRFSGMSAKSAKSTRSNTSTVVEAILVDAPSIPKRRQTLRHVRKHTALRDSSSDLSPSSSAANSSLQIEEPPMRVRPLTRPAENRHHSYASSTTVNSVSSGKARREVWRNGGIPVIVVPDRRSSSKSKSSREPSLRSTSSRRSKRSASVGSATRANGSRSNDLSTPIFDRPGRRSRTKSESDGSDQRTIDYPPVIPKRSSSLSAPTSRNTSRAGSLTAESLRAQQALSRQISGHETTLPALTLQRATSSETDNGHHHRDHKLNVDHHGDPFFGKRLDAHTTPFSAASVTSNGTTAEVSEAKAVSLFPHQNSSVLVVNHSNKPSESSDTSQTDLSKTPQRPSIVTTGPDGEGPVTPPQGQHSMDDVDSPLRNPRAAPPVPPFIPPAIQFIPATPSGLTPHHEKQRNMGNYFETMLEDPPQRSGSIVRRALSRRRNSEAYPPRSGRPGLLTRTLSLTRRGSSSSSHKGRPSVDGPCSCPDCEAAPAEDDRLHPHWRPSYSDPDDDVWEREMEDEPISQLYRYPPMSGRPQAPRRSISARMKKTFAILPNRAGEEGDSLPKQTEPERRTIRRTGSGNLRVMRRRGSLDSLRDQVTTRGFYTNRGDTNSGGFSDEVAPRRRRRFSLSGTLEGLQNIPRQMSERKRERRTQELRQKISGPREVRDGVGEVIRRNTYRDQRTSPSINF